MAGQVGLGLAQKMALITGSTSGIGLGVARRLAAHKCDIILNGFGDDKLIDNLRNEISSTYGVKTDYAPADFTDLQSVQNMVKQIRKDYPQGVDVLVNNAGFQHVSSVEEFPINKWNDLINVLLTVPFMLTQQFLPEMKTKGWGRIVNIASVHGVRASPFKAAYVSAKHGVMGLTKVVALECAGTGVACNAICPGFVDTPILQQQVEALAEKDNLSFEDAKKKFLKNYHPSGEAVGIDHIADAVVFLCSNAASNMMGTGLVMDGGWTAH